MLISTSWLGQYVDLSGIDAEQLAHRLTLSTAEVEDVRDYAHELDGVVVDVVRTNGRLSFFDGSAHLDAEVPSGLGDADRVVVDPALGVLRPPGASSGFWRTTGQLGVGVGELLPVGDVILEVDNKSLTHRPDLWGHVGFAREVAAIFGRELQVPATLDLTEEPAMVPNVEIRSPDCTYYSVAELHLDAGAPSPPTVQKHLIAVGISPISLAVDLSNFVMLEYGQPLHVFDGAEVTDVAVVPAERDFVFDSLAGTIDVERGDLLIELEGEPAALAGIVGGASSAVGAGTSTVLLEAATFASARVRRTQMRTGIRTDAGRRFEKSLSSHLAPAAAGRFVHLALAASQGARVVGSTVIGEPESPTRIPIAASAFARVMGIDVQPERAIEILTSLGFEVDRMGADELHVSVPTFRGPADVTGSHDLVEEVARIHGYDNIEPVLPLGKTRRAPLSGPLLLERHVRRVLCYAHAHTEVRTYHWYDTEWLERLGLRPEGCLELANPTAPSLRYLRSALVPNLLAVVAQNRGRVERQRVFEVGHTYRVDGHGEVDEQALLAGVDWQRSRDAEPRALVRSIRGYVEDLLRAARPSQPARWTRVDPDDVPPPFHAPLAMRVSLGDRILGHIGLLPESLSRQVGRGMTIGFWEVDLGVLGGVDSELPLIEPPPPFPGSSFDLSLTWPEESGYDKLFSSLEVDREPLVVNTHFLDQFVHDNGRLATYTFRFKLQGDRNLTTDEIARVRERLLERATAAGASV